MSDVALVDRLLSVVASSRDVAVTLADVRKELGTKRGLRDAIEEAVNLGWLETWDHPEGERLSLTPLIAERLGLILDVHGTHWHPPGWKPKKTEAYVQSRRYEKPLASLDADFRYEEHAIYEEYLPRDDEPRFFVGMAAPWHRLFEGDVCPACEGKPIPLHHYCLLCDKPRGSRSKVSPRPKRERKPWETPAVKAELRAIRKEAKRIIAATLKRAKAEAKARAKAG